MWRSRRSCLGSFIPTTRGAAWRYDDARDTSRTNICTRSARSLDRRRAPHDPRGIGKLPGASSSPMLTAADLVACTTLRSAYRHNAGAFTSLAMSLLRQFRFTSLARRLALPALADTAAAAAAHGCSCPRLSFSAYADGQTPLGLTRWRSLRSLAGVVALESSRATRTQSGRILRACRCWRSLDPAPVHLHSCCLRHRCRDARRARGLSGRRTAIWLQFSTLLLVAVVDGIRCSWPGLHRIRRSPPAASPRSVSMLTRFGHWVGVDMMLLSLRWQ